MGFCGQRKTTEPGEKPSEQGKNQQQTHPKYDTGPKSNPGHIGGRKFTTGCWFTGKETGFSADG